MLLKELTSMSCHLTLRMFILQTLGLGVLIMGLEFYDDRYNE